LFGKRLLSKNNYSQIMTYLKHIGLLVMIPFFTLALTSGYVIEDAEALKSQGTGTSKYGSSTNICGLQLCSEIPGGKDAWLGQQTPTAPVISDNEIEEKIMKESSEKMMMEDTMYEEKPYVKFMGSNALYEPSVGLVNVFGPEGLFPFFDDVFSCGNSLECGVESKDAKIWGVMNVMGDNDANMVYIEYTSPITYGDTRDENPSQIMDHKYRIELQDTNWNHPNNPIPTATPGFLLDGNGVALDQIMHGTSTIDTGHVVDGVANISLFNNKATLYGHGIIKDITNPENEFVVVDGIFLHVMVGNVIDETKYYNNLQVVPASPEIALVFAINIPSGVELPGGIGPLTPEQALSFTPPTGDPALTSHPPVDYSGLGFSNPIAHTTPWTVDNPEEPIHFTFLVFQNVESSNSATATIHTPN
jgi:hypothetical protein